MTFKAMAAETAQAIQDCVCGVQEVSSSAYADGQLGSRRRGAGSGTFDKSTTDAEQATLVRYDIVIGLSGPYSSSGICQQISARVCWRTKVVKFGMKLVICKQIFYVV